MPTGAATTTLAEAQIRELVDGWVNAVRRKDLDGIVANYASDVVIFDAIPPLRYSGVAAYRKSWQQCFDMMDGPLNYEVTELNVHASDDVAFVHCVNHMSGKVKPSDKTPDTKMDMWFRATACFRKIGGKWRVTHEHASVPFYPESNKAATDLKPCGRER